MNGRTNSAGGALVSDMEIPLDPCTDFVGVRIKDLKYLGKVRLTWTDPKDKYATPEGEAMEDTDQLVSKWSYTQIVRQADRAPVNPSDGVTVCTETTRNQYQTTGFVDTTAESNVTYYYAAYAFNEDGVYSEVISNGVQPVSFNTTLADNTWEEIDQACTLGLAESLWEIGDTKDISYYPGDMYEESYRETSAFTILDFNHDDLADGSGKACITFGSVEFFNANGFSCSNDNRGNLVTYPDSYFRNNIIDTYSIGFDSELKSIIKNVNKKWTTTEAGGEISDTNANQIIFSGITSDPLFSFSLTELGYSIEKNDDSGNVITGEYLELDDGYIYPYFSTSSNVRLSDDYWTRVSHVRSVSNNLCGTWVVTDNNTRSPLFNAVKDDRSNAIRIGFCIGKVAV